MKLVYLANSAIPSRSANSVHVMHMCDALAKQGHEVTLVTPARPEAEPDVEDVFGFYGVDGGFDMQFVPWRTRAEAFSRYALGARRIVQRVGASQVYGRFLPACWATARAGIPTWFEAHNPQRSGLSPWFYRALRRSTGHRGTVVISDALRRIMESASPGETFHVAQDAAPDPGPPAAEPAEFRVAYLGHLYAGRGIELLMEVAGRLPHVGFDIVGGTDADVARVRDAGVPSNVALHGFVPPSQTEAFRRASSVLVAPYGRRVSGLTGAEDTVDWMSPLKIFEYMASGRAIVASDLPALHEVLESEQNCLLAAPEDPDAWLEAIVRLHHDVDLRRSLAARARADFERQHSWHARAAKISAWMSG